MADGELGLRGKGRGRRELWHGRAYQTGGSQRIPYCLKVQVLCATHRERVRDVKGSQKGPSITIVPVTLQPSLQHSELATLLQ